jgi:hypothetical protein
VWRSVVASIDIVTALCAGFNFVYFARRFTAPGNTRPSRRLAAAVLAVVSLGAVVESVAFLALAAQGEAVAPASASWAMIRAFTMAGAVAMFGLVARRMVER